MDYRNEEFLRESVGKFGKMRGWFREDPSPTRTMVKCAYGGARDIPHSIVIREPQRYGGTVVSWIVPVFIMLTDQADVLPGYESPEPHNGNPHPPPGGPGGFDGQDDDDDDWIPDDVAPNLPGWGQGLKQHVNVVPRVADPVDALAIVPFAQQNVPEDVQNSVQIFRVVMPDSTVLWDDFFKRKLPSLYFSKIDKKLDLFGALPLSLCDVSLLEPEGTEDAMTVMPKKKRARKEKGQVNLVVSEKRSTRSCTKNGGYKLTPMLEKEPRKKPRVSKPRAKKPEVAPGTPIKVLQQAGEFLEIPQAELAVEKLMAAPEEDSSSSSSNE
ncbi:hypothetical protein ACQ4PT_022372 [Festuca glaucescens]